MDLTTIKQFANVPIVNKANVAESKLTILILGEEKVGKTHFWCTFPKPIVCLYTETNQETPDGFIRDFDDGAIQLIKLPSATPGISPIKDWDFYANQFVPVVQNRMLEAKTVVVDNYAGISQAITTMKSGGGTASIQIQQWGQILDAHIDRMNALLSAARPVKDQPDKPSYNLVVTAHLTDVTNDKGALLRTRPAITGAFKDAIGGKFGSVFIAKAKVKHDIVDLPGGGKEMMPAGAKHFLYTVPPTEYLACGDGVGGKGGRKELPGVIENTYQALCEAWGIKEDE